MKAILLLFLISSISIAQVKDEQLTRINEQIDSLETQKKELITQAEEIKLSWIQDQLKIVGLPIDGPTGELVEHVAMTLSYNETHEQANWVMHVILPDIASGNFSRSNDFRIDPGVSTGTAQEEDYFLKGLKDDGVTYKYDGFGYDRGHLAPSADFRWSSLALSESYFYSNMSPQLGDFNREKWAELENWLRGYVLTCGVELYIVTAPVLTEDLTKVERSVNGVSVPRLYVKAAFDIENKRGIGFVMENKFLELPVEAYAVSIDSVENLLGYNLFSGIVDSIENRVEASYNLQYWFPDREKGDAAAISPKRLPKKASNTYGVHVFADDGKKHTVCGKVVSAKKSEKGHVFLNLDKKFPNQIFSASIFEQNIPNFEYEPEVYLMDKEVCFTAEIGMFNNTPNMVLENSKEVKLLNEMK